GLFMAPAFSAGKKTTNSTEKRINISKVRVPSDMQRKLLVPLKSDDGAIIQSGTSEAVLQGDTIWMDDFEGGQPQWQATASWGSTVQGVGVADEDHSDWGLNTTNFNSPTTSSQAWSSLWTTIKSMVLLLEFMCTLELRKYSGLSIQAIPAPGQAPGFVRFLLVPLTTSSSDSS
ncbi:MAG: hypothetical protein ACYTBZ_30250, partial [Planctomycetota bacterium]